MLKTGETHICGTRFALSPMKKLKIMKTEVHKKNCENTKGVPPMKIGVLIRALGNSALTRDAFIRETKCMRKAKRYLMSDLMN